MDTLDILNTLNDRFAIPFKLRFKAFGDSLIAADITNAHGTASLCLQGGHLLSWQPVSTDQPVIWMSPAATFAPHTPIRGGIPICWPWFAANATDVTLPFHGFARTQPWQVTGSRSLDDGSTEIALSYLPTDETQQYWPQANATSRLDLLVNVGASLKIALITRNLGASDFTITEALHTYFAVSDVAQAQVDGLDGAHFHDKAAGWAQGDQTGGV
ncbi:MAG: D-hexose-6-phosphate mutarotase, partial [Burkholderiaceae bacterium]